jgi:hypothetical protein
MPKIRGIKPDFWTDEDIVELSIPARMMFIGLWTYACDNGHLQDKPKQLKMRLFPGDEVSAAALLRELESAGRIVRDAGWVIIPNFTKHQRPDRRYFQTCDAPGCTKPGDSQPETRGGHHETTPRPHRAPAVVSMGPHVDGDGDGEMKVSGAPKRRATTIPTDWQPNDAHRKIAGDERVNCDSEAKKFRDSNIAKGRTYIDWDAAFRNWLRSPYAVKTGPPTEVTDPGDLPPVEDSWMRRRPS